MDRYVIMNIEDYKTETLEDVRLQQLTPEEIRERRNQIKTSYIELQKQQNNK